MERHDKSSKMMKSFDEDELDDDTTDCMSSFASGEENQHEDDSLTNSNNDGSNKAWYLEEELHQRVQTEPELFDFVQKAALDGMWYWDLENMENEWMSPEFKALFGYEDHEVPNTSAWWQNNIFPEDKQLALEMFHKHVKEGVPYSCIVRYRHKNGSTVWVRCRGLASFNEEGKPVRMLGAHNDLTALMKTQEELKKKEAVLDMLCTTALDGFWDWNMKTGEDFLSVRWKNALGYEDDELENTVEAWKSLLHPDDVSKAYAAVQRHLDEGAPYSEVLRYKRKDGSFAHMLAQGVAQKDETGEWARMFGTHTDVSYLEEARAARQANQAKSTFLATMSHEIRTPLNAVLGMAQVLMDTKLTDEQRDCLKTLEYSGQHLLSVISDILDFSQIETGKVTLNTKEFNVQATVRDVVSVLRMEAIKKGIDLIFLTEVPAGGRFLGDPERIRQIIFNLIANAIKFTKRGSVRVSVGLEERESLQGIRVDVQDTGCGIAADQIERIFNNFTQANSEIRHQYGGSGLGLSISQKLAFAMGGAIKVDSQLGEGSTFSIWIPGFIPESVSRNILSGTALLYETYANDLENENSTIYGAVRGAGLEVSRVHNMTDLQKQLDQNAAQAVIFDSQREESCCVSLGDFLQRNPTTATILVGSKGLDPIVKEKHKDHLWVVPPMPTSDDIHEALVQQGQKQAPKVNMYRLGNLPRDLRILLAEDNKINVKVMLKMLGKLPCKVQVACNGREAVELSEKDTYDIILMDMIMPELDGVLATQIIRQRDKDTPIYALTANATTDDRDTCLKAGMCGFLTKPIDLQLLCDVLTKVSISVSKTEQALDENLPSNKS